MVARDRVRSGAGLVVCLTLLIALGACQSSPPAAREAAPVTGAGEESQVVKGTVRHIDLEGGFYGIVTDDGTNLDPVNLPEEFRKDGVRLQARVVPLRDRVSIHMWGTPVRIIEFKRL